jgi:DNA repair ATPase RecN
MIYLLDIRNNVVQKNRKNDIDESCNELMQKYSDMLNSEVLSKPFSSIGKSLNGSSQEVNISEMIKTVFVQFEKGTNTVDMVKNVMNGLNKAIEDAQTYERLKATNNYIAETMFDILNLKSCIDQQRGVSNECLDLNK